jgi:hypothetical protein
MSNRANIIQQTTIEKHSGRESKEVVVSDDYGMGVIDLEGRSDTFYDNDLELLKMVIHIITEDGLESINHVLINVQDNERGMNIEGTWYDWDEIKDILEANNG